MQTEGTHGPPYSLNSNSDKVINNQLIVAPTHIECVKKVREIHK